MNGIQILKAEDLDQSSGITGALSRQDAETIFAFFRQHSLFRWHDALNDCEDRANAISILLDQWHLPNLKAWVFAGDYYGGASGYLQNCWNYHVAAALPVEEDGVRSVLVIDPATCPGLCSIEAWAQASTAEGTSYFAARDSKLYIFCPPHLARNDWHERDARNYKWTMQGLAGINGVSKKGKAELVFRKKKIADTEAKFRRLMKQGSPLSSGKQTRPVGTYREHTEPAHNHYNQPT